MGVIEALPASQKPGGQLVIHHEAIPDFQSRDGRLGMKEMGMPFPIGDGVSLVGLAVGVRVQFEFTVDWNASPSYWITRIEPIAAEKSGD